MATTAGGSTYVISTDLVADYPTASLALANRVDVVASGGPNSIKTSGYTITLADILGGNKFLYNSASPGTFTLPTSGLVDGMVVNVAQIGAGALTVSGGTIVGTTVTTAQYQGLQFVYASTGTTWYSVAPNVTAPGLAIVTPTSIANSGGSSSATGGQVTFTGVTSISLNGVFTSTYENYFVTYTWTQNTTPDSTLVRLRVGGVDSTGGNYDEYRVYAGTSAARYNNITSWGNSIIGGTGAANTNFASLQMYKPQLAVPTMLSTVSNYAASGSYPLSITMVGSHSASTSYDGISFIANAGTLTGTIRVYGYRN